MITLIALKDTFAIYQLKPGDKVPSYIFSGEFYSITRTPDEISIITNHPVYLPSAKSNEGWKGFKVDGVLDFSLVGIINDITRPLKDNGISVFVISTYNTDYIFVKEENFLQSKDILKGTAFLTIKDE